MLRSAALKLMHYSGLDISRTPSPLAFLESRNVDLVIDVGGNIGQFASRLREQGYHGRIWSFEPVSQTFAALEKASANDPLWTVTQAAVGDQAGEVDINVSDNSVYSSILPTTALGQSFDSRIATMSVETVPVVTLDAAVGADDARAIFLKVDTQGFEQQVLAGAKRLLDRCVGIQLELPSEHLYAGVWSFSEAIAAIDTLGFTPAQSRQVNAIPDDPASAIEFDVIFRRKKAN